MRLRACWRRRPTTGSATAVTLTLINQLVKGPPEHRAGGNYGDGASRVGRYSEAVGVQRDALTAATTARLAKAEQRVARTCAYMKVVSPVVTHLEKTSYRKLWPQPCRYSH